MSKLKLLIGLGVTAILFAYLMVVFDFGEVIFTIRSYNPLQVVLATVAVTASIAASCLRYFSILRSFQVAVDFKTAIRANILGAFGGLLLFQFFGQTLARATVLRRHAVPLSTVLMTNVYERLLALAFLFIYALLGALVIYESISFDWEGGGADLTKLGLYAVLAGLAPMLLVYRRLTRLTLRALGRLARTRSLLRDCVSTVIVHLAMFAAYILLAHNYVLDVSFFDLAAATFLVMFAASLPISFAGWGVREVSAVYAYGVIGIDPVTALSISVLIGMVSIVVLALSVSLVSLLVSETPSRSAQPASGEPAGPKPINFDRALCLAIPLLAATAILFQVHIPSGSGAINVNLSDPLAIAGGCLFLVRMLKLHALGQRWILPKFELILIAFTVIFLSSLFHGFWLFGVTDWALYNRGLGWLMLLAYVGTGALIVTELGKVGQHTVAKTVIVSAAVLASIETFLLLTKIYGLHELTWTGPDVFKGMAGNRNAFAFQLLIAVSLLTGLRIEWNGDTPWVAKGAKSLLLVVLLSAIYYTQSRTGLITSIALLTTIALFGLMPLRQLLTVVIVTAVVAMLPVLIPKGLALVVASLQWLAPSSTWLAALLEGLATNYTLPTAISSSSDLERWRSISDGVSLWLSAPILGAGLGAFIHAETVQNAQALVIHSTPIWLLAECGVIGLLPQLSLFWIALKSFFKQFRLEPSPARATLLVLLVYGLFQLPHDMFYQRLLWFALGMLLLNPSRWSPASEPQGERSPRSQDDDSPHLGSAKL